MLNAPTVSRLGNFLWSDNIGTSKAPIQIQVKLYKIKQSEVRGEILDVPLELTNDEIEQSLLRLCVTFTRRYQYRNKDGETPSGSVLLCFAATFLPQVVSIGYLRFKIRPYKPPTYVASIAIGMAILVNTVAAAKGAKNVEKTTLPPNARILSTA